ncbi:D-glycero-alpha-D-manno-heptose-1,7-bisphosphate 7-phosphatase [Verrucomicrobiota bacterium]
MNTRKCVFFDRDGIVNEAPDPERYVLSWKNFHLIPEFVDSLRTATQNGYQAVIVSNQRAVARGLLPADRLDEMHRRLKRLLSRDYHLELLDITYCPHNPGECSCRKPQPGMLLAMAEKHNLDLPSSWMVGDSETDIEAGCLAGCHTILVGTASPDSKAEAKVPSMSGLPRLLDVLLSS